MKNNIILTTAEIQHNVVVKRIPIKTKGRKWTPTIPPYEMQNGEMCFSELPYKPGQVVYVREAWNCLRLGNGRNVPYETTYWYRADEKDNNPDNKWWSACIMPKEAARLWMIVRDVKAVFDGQWYWEVTMERTEAQG